MKLLEISTVLTLLFSSGFARSADHQHHHDDAKKISAQEQTLSEESIYSLGSVLLDRAGKEVSIKSLAGQPVVISMAYTSCAYTCPLILSAMQILEKDLVAKGKTNVRFILVSFDPKHDTPKVLSNYFAAKKLSPRWELLTSKGDKEPREIANLLGIKYKQVEGGDYDHSFIISVLDSQGVIKGQQVGANGDPKDLAKYLP